MNPHGDPQYVVYSLRSNVYCEHGEHDWYEDAQACAKAWRAQWAASYDSTQVFSGHSNGVVSVYQKGEDPRAKAQFERRFAALRTA